MRVTHRIATLFTIATASALAVTAPAAAAASATAGGHRISAQGHQSGRAAALTVTANWAQFRYSHQHTGYNPNEHLLSPANVASLHPDWSSAAGESGTSPAVVNGVLYVTNPGGGVYAVNASTGPLLWNYDAGGGTGQSSPAVANGVVYIGTHERWHLTSTPSTPPPAPSCGASTPAERGLPPRRWPTGWSTSAPEMAASTP